MPSGLYCSSDRATQNYKIMLVCAGRLSFISYAVVSLIQWTPYKCWNDSSYTRVLDDLIGGLQSPIKSLKLPMTWFDWWLDLIAIIVKNWWFDCDLIGRSSDLIGGQFWWFDWWLFPTMPMIYVSHGCRAQFQCWTEPQVYRAIAFLIQTRWVLLLEWRRGEGSLQGEPRSDSIFTESCMQRSMDTFFSFNLHIWENVL